LLFGKKDSKDNVSQMKIKRITLVISSLGMGGAEKSLILLANTWVTREIDVDIITFSSPKDPIFFPIDERVNVVHLSAHITPSNYIRSIGSNFKRIRRLRKKLSEIKPDIVVSFIDQTNISTLLATFFSSIPVVVAERTDPSQHSIGKLWSILRHATYPFADTIIVQTHSVKKKLPFLWKRKTQVIPNAVSPPSNTEYHCPITQPFIFAAGRFSHEKGFDLLIEGFSQIAAFFPQWQLAIAGDGPLHEKLTAQAQRYGLNKRIHFLGIKKELQPFYKNADIFVLPSRYEGFPNALCEAMTHATPVIATDCPSGPRDIIHNKTNGYLIQPESAHAIAKALEELMHDKCLRNRLGQEATKIATTLSTNNIIVLWNEILEKIISQTQRRSSTG